MKDLHMKNPNLNVYYGGRKQVLPESMKFFLKSMKFFLKSMKFFLKSMKFIIVNRTNFEMRIFDK